MFFFQIHTQQFARMQFTGVEDKAFYETNINCLSLFYNDSTVVFQFKSLFCNNSTVVLEFKSLFCNNSTVV